MHFCTDHWDRLRKAIEERGLASLVPDSGEKAASNMARELEGERSIDTFDPLMNAHWAIVNNLMAIASNPIAVMQHDGCPLCLANETHEAQCTDPDCEGPRDTMFDSWIDKAADEQVEVWKELNEG